QYAGVYYNEHARINNHGVDCDNDVTGVICYYCGTGNYEDWNTKIQAKHWYTLCNYWDGTSTKMSLFNGTVNVENITRLDCPHLNLNPFLDFFSVGTNTNTLVLDNYREFNYTSIGERGVSAHDYTPPVLSDYNCTSCDPPNGDNQSPYETYDTTPTFSFNTNENAYCRIGDKNLNWSSMNSSRDCDTGEGTTGPHICTLDPSDELKLTPTDYVYISCRNGYYSENTTSSSGPLEISIGQVQYNASIAIEEGITISIPSATIYSDQQVYVRTVSNNQSLAVFDKVALYGTQRWAFNYVSLPNESSIGTFYNLSPVFYFLEMINLTKTEISRQVSSLINNTRT
ncbi:hypothetical protein KY366_06930, partial [Candidatus Woesearchaeota archaeon]|nr:hypothetical protein [Candidatus Woesearchaeota archaeon]